MKWIERLEALADRLEARAEGRQPSARVRPPYVRSPATEEDIASWLDSAYNPLADKLKSENPFRWARLQSDVKWAMREAEKMGYDPNSVGRWLT